jgi:hypothetical protein
VANSDVPGSEPPTLAMYVSGRSSLAPPQTSGATGRSTPNRTVTGALAFLAYAALVGAVLSLPAALLWNLVADPPEAAFTKQGVFLGEQQLNQQAEVSLLFLAVGFGFGLAAGLATGWLGRRRGALTVLAVLVLCAVAAVLTSYLGISVFGPDAKAQAGSADVGSLITTDLTIGSKLMYLGWPIGGMVGACVAIMSWPVPANVEQPPR